MSNSKGPEVRVWVHTYQALSMSLHQCRLVMGRLRPNQFEWTNRSHGILLYWCLYIEVSEPLIHYLKTFKKFSLGAELQEKGIALPELSCRTAAELPPPDFSAPGRHPPEQPGSFGGSSAPGVQCRVRRQSGSSGGWSSAAQLPEYNPFLLHVGVLGLQRVKAKLPFPQFFSTMAEISPTTSLYLLWKCQRRQTVFMIHNIIRGAHSFWPWY